MKRFMIYDPKGKSFIKIVNGGWASGFAGHEVDHYGSLEEAQAVIKKFDSLKHCVVSPAAINVHFPDYFACSN